MAMTVHGDLVTRGRDLGGVRRKPLDLLADEKERGRHTGPSQHLEDGRRSLRMRAVVERQCDPARLVEAGRDA